MPTVIQFLREHHEVRTFLVALAVFVVLFAWRRLFPASYERLPEKLREFPPIFVGLVLTWVVTQVEALRNALTAGDGVLGGLAAIGGHWFLKNTPWISYGNPKTSSGSSGSSGLRGTGAAIIFSLVAVIGCSPATLASATAALSTVDAIARALPPIVQTCQDAGADALHVARARDALERKDYATAVTETRALVEALRRRGAAIPEQVDVTLSLAEGAAAAQAVQEDMTALSKPDAGK